MRVNLDISQKQETNSILRLSDVLLKKNFNASNTVIISVSADYSNIAGQLLRHSLSYDGEICDGFSIDVPYPDEVWDSVYIRELESLMNLYEYKLTNKKILLVEAGVIRGSNYKFIVDYFRTNLKLIEEIYTLAVYENIHSKFTRKLYMLVELSKRLNIK